MNTQFQKYINDSWQTFHEGYDRQTSDSSANMKFGVAQLLLTLRYERKGTQTNTNMWKSSRICNFLNSSSYLHIFVTLIFDILAKLQFMVWGSGAPGAPGAPGAHGALGLPGLPDDEFVMNSKSEMACFAEGIKFIFQISVLISKCQL